MQKQKAKDAAKEDRDISNYSLPACLPRGGSICLGLKRWGRVPQVEEVEHVQRPRGTKGLCGLRGQEEVR